MSMCWMPFSISAEADFSEKSRSVQEIKNTRNINTNFLLILLFVIFINKVQVVNVNVYIIMGIFNPYQNQNNFLLFPGAGILFIVYELILLPPTHRPALPSLFPSNIGRAHV